MSEKLRCYVCENFCVYIESDFLCIRLTLDLNSALDSTDRGKHLFIEHWDHSLVFQDSFKSLDSLFMCPCSKSLAHHSRWLAGLSVWKLISF